MCDKMWHNIFTCDASFQVKNYHSNASWMTLLWTGNLVHMIRLSFHWDIWPEALQKPHTHTKQETRGLSKKHLLRDLERKFDKDPGLHQANRHQWGQFIRTLPVIAPLNELSSIKVIQSTDLGHPGRQAFMVKVFWRQLVKFVPFFSCKTNDRLVFLLPVLVWQLRQHSVMMIAFTVFLCPHRAYDLRSRYLLVLPSKETALS